MTEDETVRLAYLRMLDRCEPFPDGHGLRFTGAHNARGYGVVRVGKRLMLAHRLAYLARTGELPPVVQHRCDRPACVDEGCLEAGTWATNNRDCAAKGRARRNPRRGADHPNARLRPGQVRVIRRRHAKGATAAQLARAFGVSDQTIGMIVKRRRYAGVI